ncbi:MAG: nucleotide-binding protein [Gammaproteobacteria bacterium]|nr:nucleotide-binding protein [Gammaproteobacteria bacterium]
MALPIKTTLDDIVAVCEYLAKKPMGATLKDAKTVLDNKHLGNRKLAALKYWGLLENQEKLKLTSLGREAARNNNSKLAYALNQIIHNILPYRAIVEKAEHRKEESLTSVEVATHWHDHFPEEASTNETSLNDQAICFFQIASGAELGELILGRRGLPTRFQFDKRALSSNSNKQDVSLPESASETSPNNASLHGSTNVNPSEGEESSIDNKSPNQGQGIFIAHGKNNKPLEQLKKILDQFKIPYKVAVEEPNLGRPIGAKVKEIMQSCNCAILIFTADEELQNKEGKTIWRPSENVSHELGAASYLYDNRIVILKEAVVEFPSNFRDICYISFKKDQLAEKSMDVLQELIGFGIVKIST